MKPSRTDCFQFVKCPWKEMNLLPLPLPPTMNRIAKQAGKLAFVGNYSRRRTTVNLKKNKKKTDTGKPFPRFSNISHVNA